MYLPSDNGSATVIQALVMLITNRVISHVLRNSLCVHEGVANFKVWRRNIYLGPSDFEEVVPRLEHGRVLRAQGLHNNGGHRRVPKTVHVILVFI